MAWISKAESRRQPWESSAPKQCQPWESSAEFTDAMVRQHRPWESSASTHHQSWESSADSRQHKSWESLAPTLSDHPWISKTEVTEFLKRDLQHLESLGATPIKLLPCGSLQPRNLTDAIIATVISTSAVVGGVALIVVSAGAATPGVAAGWGALAGGTLGVGIAGTVNAGSGIHNGNFRWERWGTDVGFAAGTSLITFPTCFFGGQAVTAALIQGAKLSVNTAKGVAIAVASLTGAGIHEGSCFVKCSVEGRDPEVIELVLNGIGGMLEGGGAAYLGIRVNDPKRILEVVEIQEYDQQIRILRGIHHDDHKGFGVQHMLKQRNNAEILGVSNELKPFAKELKRIMEKGPVGYQKIGGNNLKPVYMAKNGNLFSLGISREPCMINQMNPVSANKVQWIVNICD